MKRKKVMAILMAGTLVFSCVGCGSTTKEGESDSTITGKVTEINDTSVTIQLGELMQGGEPNGEKPDGEAPDGEKPEMPDGETPDGEKPEMPDGETPDGEKPEMPEGEAPDGENPPQGGGIPFEAGDETKTIDLKDAEIVEESGQETEEADFADIEVDDILVIELGDDGTVESVTIKSGRMGGPGGFGGSGEVTQGTAANTIENDAEVTEESYTSSGDDENALRVKEATVTLDGITVEKTAGESSNTEDGDFYGQNAALLATDGAQVTIKNAKISSSAQNGNGVFSYGEGTVVTISDSSIETTKDNSGGIQTTGGGTTKASNLTINTKGNSSAAIRSDRGGGTVEVDGGTYLSEGYNSPSVYSTAAITVKNATLTAANSEALVIEGQNSISLENCNVTGNMSDTEGSSSDINVHNVMIYQSMSGDAEVGTSEFSMEGGSLTSQNGDMFYVTNTHCTIRLSGVLLVNQDEEGNLMTITGNDASHGWGEAGSNGGQVNFTADGQTLDGNIVVDTISNLNLTLSNGSQFTGSINITENEEGGEAVEDNAVITVDEGCTWTLTGDCTVTSVTDNGTINFNGHTITLADGTVLSE
ncbi:MAG: hypothetical protein Q4F24_01635 [Eubacteriales bacterium]|nr:hypothetical protein [Eubacteriales bacterium]